MAKLREQTQTFLAGNLAARCPSVANPQLASAVSAADVRNQLVGVNAANMLERIDAALPAARASGAEDDDIVNGLTAAYCPDAFATAGDHQAKRLRLLGQFSVLAYGQLKVARPPE